MPPKPLLSSGTKWAFCLGAVAALAYMAAAWWKKDVHPPEAYGTSVLIFIEVCAVSSAATSIRRLWGASTEDLGTFADQAQLLFVALLLSIPLALWSVWSYFADLFKP